MAPVSNKRVVFKKWSQGTVIPGETTLFDANGTIDIDNVPLNGGILLKILMVLLAPGLQVMMTETCPFGSFKIDAPVQSAGIAIVVRSENPAFHVGDHVHGYLSWEEYSVRHDVELIDKVENEFQLPWKIFLGPGGLSGLTAYAGWKEYANAKKGEVVFVSSGAGSVGSFVIQLAKRDGLKVIASAGSQEKVRFMKDLGADVAFNYKTTKTSEILEEEGPIDIYWDNVGGDTLVDALNAAARYARFVECGMVSTYGRSPTMLNLADIIVKEIKMYGFLVHTLAPKYLDGFKRDLLPLLASKELKHEESVTGGLENAEVALVKFLEGAFIGMSVVMVAYE